MEPAPSPAEEEQVPLLNTYKQNALPYSGAKGPQRHLSSLNLGFAAIGLLVPWGVFVLNYAAFCFTRSGGLPVLIILAILTAACGAMGGLSWYKQTRNPTWFFVMCFMMIVALVTSSYFGAWNYRENMEPYSVNHEMNSAHDTDPATTSGAEVMDAAMIFFRPNATIDAAGAISFRNRYTYCVAPIVMQNQTQGVYNFWAVGVDCCPKLAGGRVDFRCGAYGAEGVHSGLRAYNDVDFYRLAVTQAEARDHIEARQPVFLFWTGDPVAELETYKEDAVRWYLVGIFAHLCTQTGLLVLTTLAMLYKLL